MAKVDPAVAPRLPRDSLSFWWSRRWLQFELWAIPGNSLRWTASNDLKDLAPRLPHRGWRLVQWAFPVIQFGTIVLAYYRPTVSSSPPTVGFPNGVVNTTILVGVWGMEATLFGLVAGFAPLVITTSSNLIDRSRMVRRHQRDAFNWFLTLGLVTLLMTGAGVLFLKQLDSSGERAAASLWLGLSFAIFLGGAVFTIVYTFRLISATAEVRLDWIIEDALEYSWLTLVDARALKLLETWVREAGLRKDKWARLVKQDPDESPLTVVFDARLFKKSQPLEFLPANTRRDVYVSDISLRRLSMALESLASPEVTAFRKICVVAFLHRRLKPGIPIAGIQVVEGQENAGRRALDQLTSAFLLKAWSPKTFFYRVAFKDLRDKACAAAREGRIAEFELLLEGVTEIAIRYYETAEEVERRELFTIDEFPLHLEPRGALRAVVHELGEEVLASRSPNIIKAWIHHPHSVMERTRYHPTRVESAAMYAWFRTANLIRDTAKDSTDVALVMESLRRRLLTYGQDVANALRIRQGVPSGNGWTFEREAEWYVRAVGKLLSAIGEDERAYTITDVSKVLLGFPNPEQHLGAIWIECARHLAADFMNPDPGKGLTSTAVELGRAMNGIRAVFPDLWLLLCSWRLLALTEERREQTIAQLYQQLVDLSWDEQIEMVTGVLDPVMQPYRGKLGITLIALELATTNEVRCLREDDSLRLFDLVDRESDQIDGLKKLAGVLGSSINVPTAITTILACVAYHFIVPRVAGEQGLTRDFLEPDACQRLIADHLPGSGAEQLVHEIESLIDGAIRVTNAQIRINSANYDAFRQAGAQP
jgi:hypothetical protein